jgi:hypothetical protein
MINVVHIQVKETGPVFSQEQGVLTGDRVCVNHVNYLFDYSVGGVDIFQNFNFAHMHTTTLANSRFLGDHFVLPNVDTKRAVLLWDSWTTTNVELPEVVVPPPSAISISGGLVAKRSKKGKVEEVKEPEEEEEEEEEDDDDDDNDEEDGGEGEKPDDVIIE